MIFQLFVWPLWVYMDYQTTNNNYTNNNCQPKEQPLLHKAQQDTADAQQVMNVHSSNSLSISPLTNANLGDEESKLLEWCANCCRNYPGVVVENFTASWADGLLFNALIHYHDPTLFDYQNVYLNMGVKERIIHAFDILKQLNISLIIGPKDISLGDPDSTTVILYVLKLFQVSLFID